MGQSLALSGTDDAVLQMISVDVHDVPAVSSPYVLDSTLAFAHGLNLSSDAAPTWTAPSGNSTYLTAGIAFKGE